MDEQRCAAPQISQNWGTPSTQRKDYPISDGADKLPQRSASFNSANIDQQQQVRCHAPHNTACRFLIQHCSVNLHYFNKGTKITSQIKRHSTLFQRKKNAYFFPDYFVVSYSSHFPLLCIFRGRLQ